MPERAAARGLRARDLCRLSLEWAIGHGLLPQYVPTGKYRRPPEPPHPLNFGKDTWLVAHYADWRGPLYRQEEAWQRAFAFVNAFTERSLARRPRLRWELPRLYGSFGDLEPPSVLAETRAGLLRQGFDAIDVNERSFSGVFRLADSCKGSDLPEPYGKWQQRAERLVWENDSDLCVEVSCQVHVRPRRLPPPGYRSYLDLTLSAPAPLVLTSLREHLSRTLHPSTLLGATELERMLVDSLRALIATW